MIAIISPATPQIPTIARCSNSKPDPAANGSKAESNILARCCTGNMALMYTIQSGAFSRGMKTSDTKSKGITDAFTMAGAAFAFGITVVMARPSEEKVKSPRMMLQIADAAVVLGRVTP